MQVDTDDRLGMSAIDVVHLFVVRQLLLHIPVLTNDGR